MVAIERFVRTRQNKTCFNSKLDSSFHNTAALRPPLINSTNRRHVDTKLKPYSASALGPLTPRTQAASSPFVSAAN